MATSFEQLRGGLKPGDTIQVTDTNGHKTTGQLGELTSYLELLVRKTEFDGRDTRVPQRPRLSEHEVSKITLERRDSLLNGALIGLAAGAGPGLLSLQEGREGPTRSSAQIPRSVSG